MGLQSFLAAKPIPAAIASSGPVPAPEHRPAIFAAAVTFGAYFQAQCSHFFTLS